MEQPSQHPDPDLLERFRALSRGRKIIVVVFLIWAAQAVPKWSAAILADGEAAAAIMTVFITPRGHQPDALSATAVTAAGSDPCPGRSGVPCTAAPTPSCSSPC